MGKKIIVNVEDIAWIRVYHVPVDLRRPEWGKRLEMTRGTERQTARKDGVTVLFSDRSLADRYIHQDMLAKVLAEAMNVETDSIRFKSIRSE